MAEPLGLMALDDADMLTEDAWPEDGMEEGSPPGPYDDLDEGDILACIREYKRVAQEARALRLRMNERNMDAFFSRQDWSHKEEGQSAEFWPKTAEAVKQFKMFVKKGLTDYGDWFSMDYNYGVENRSGFTADSLRRLLLAKLETLNYSAAHRTNFATLIADGLHTGSLESLMIFKVYGEWVQMSTFVATRPVAPPPAMARMQAEDTLAQQTSWRWHLRMDLVPFPQYLADPQGDGLFEIHSVERDLADIQAMAEGPEPVYDPAVVEMITASCATSLDEQRPERMRGQQQTHELDRRKRCVVDEMWGTLLGRNGEVLARNIVCTIVNDQYIVRWPEPNPHWHGQSPFVIGAIDRVPFSTLHQALFDSAVSLNLTINELVSLIVDGGIAEVWGTRQLRRDWLERPEQVSGGVSQGDTLEIKSEVPIGGKVLETVATGTVPPSAMQLLQLLLSEFHTAAMTNDLRLGNVPHRPVLASVAMEAQQGQAGLVDGILRDIEDTCIEPLLRKAWLTILQHIEQLPAQEVIGAMGLRSAMALGRLSPAERFAMFAQSCTFTVHGLSASLARLREFQKLTGFFAMMKDNPFLAQVFLKRFSMDKLLSRVLKSLNIDPDALEVDDQERMQQQAMMQMAGQGPPSPERAGGGAPGSGSMAPLPGPGPMLPRSPEPGGGTGMLPFGQEGGVG